MPKNANPPRGGSKKPAPPPQDDGIEIIFGDKPRKARRLPPNENEVAEGSKTKVKTKGEPAADDVPKKPDTRTLIGGTSWTGKLPLNMFSEHCQKQKWDKAEYTMMKTDQGFISGVILKKMDPKTKQPTTLPLIRIPKDHWEMAGQETAVEARHFAATYALFRVCSGKNLHMMLPPKYRDLWRGLFSDLKKDDEGAGKGWMYAPDPFAMLKEREEDQAAKAKQREDRERARAKEASGQGRGPGGIAMNGGSDSRGPKPWTRAPKIEMGKKTRLRVEALIRQHAVWGSSEIELSNQERSKLVVDVTRLGFRKAHVEEGMEVCQSREEVLEWLLIHVPEDDLPKWSLPENYVAGVSLASSDLKREGTIKRLAATGYAADLVEGALDANGGDETKAASCLQALLLEEGTDLQSLTELIKGMVIEEWEDNSVWTDEQEVLVSIYDSKFSATGKTSYSIRVQPEGVDTPIMLMVRKPVGAYPDVLPLLAIHAQMPAYIRLSILKQALQFAKDNLLGDQMIFSIVDWIEHNAAGMIENPGRLADVSTATAAGESKKVATHSRSKTNRRRPRPLDRNAALLVSKQMLHEWQKKQSTTEQEKMLRVRKALPAWNLRIAIVEAVNNHQVTIISGETGSGKSTQSVQVGITSIRNYLY